MPTAPPAPPPAPPAQPWRRAGPLVAATLLLAALPSLPAGVHNWDNQVKLQLARSLLAGEGLTLTGPTPEDSAYVVLGRDGRRFTTYPPLVVVPALVVLASGPPMGEDHEGMGALVLLALLGWALVAWGRAAGVAPAAAVAGALLATAGTVLWPMAAHGYDVLVEALALALILRAGAAGPRPSAWALAGLALGAAFATRLGAALLGVAAAAAWLHQAWRSRERGPSLRAALALAAGAAPGLGLVAWLNQVRYGSPLAVQPATNQAATVPWLGQHHLEGMAGLLVSPGKGLLWYAPPLLAVLLLARPLARRHPGAALALGAQLAASVVGFGRLAFWHGDWAWGPRYVAPLCVAAAPLAWLAVERAAAAGRAARGGVAAALGLAAALQVAPAVGYPVAQYFRRTLTPLSAAGRLVTRPVTHWPLPEDNRVLYFEPANAPPVALAAGLREGLADERTRGLVARLLLRGLLLPAAVVGLFAALGGLRPGAAHGAGGTMRPG